MAKITMLGTGLIGTFYIKARGDKQWGGKFKHLLRNAIFRMNIV